MVEIKYAQPKISAGHLVGSHGPKMARGPQFGNHWCKASVPCLSVCVCVCVGKLQTMDVLLRRMKAESHRALIFTQMTKMLDVLESFLNFHGHRYLRLDGTTKVLRGSCLNPYSL